MRIGIFNNGIFRWGDNAYKMLKKAGFDCVDYNQITPLTGQSDEDFLKVLLHDKELADEAGIEINQSHGPWRWPPQDDTLERREERLATMKRSIEFSAMIGCKNWVIHPIMPFGIEDIGTGKEAETRALNLEFMSKLLEKAKECDVTICFENMPMTKFSLGSAEKVIGFVKEMNDPHFKVCLDTGHVNVFSGKRPGEAVRTMGSDLLRVLHIHDNDTRHDRHYMPYLGNIDWRDFGSALHDIDFKGVLSFEMAPPLTMPLNAAEKMYAALAMIGHSILGE